MVSLEGVQGNQFCTATRRREREPSPWDIRSLLFSARSRVEGEANSRITRIPPPGFRSTSQPASSYQRQKWAHHPPSCGPLPPAGWWWLHGCVLHVFAFAYACTTSVYAVQIYVYKVAGARRRVQNTRYARSTHRVTNALKGRLRSALVSARKEGREKRRRPCSVPSTQLPFSQSEDRNSGGLRVSIRSLLLSIHSILLVSSFGD